MNISELADLIPLYVTGKVTKEQKVAIENALSQSKELQEELAFWQTAREVAAKAAMYSAEEHLESKQIVEYARGTVSDAMEGLRIQRHLQSCASCAEDYQIVHQAFARDGNRKRANPVFSTFSGILKPTYSIPVLAVLIICSIVLWDLVMEPNAKVDLILAYQSHERSIESSSFPTLSLDKRVEVVHISALVPHTKALAVSYSLALFSPGARQASLTKQPTMAVGTSFDTLAVSIPASVLSNEGVYTLLVTLAYPGTSRDFEYNYGFKLVFEK